jgi:hypothetical protein
VRVGSAMLRCSLLRLRIQLLDLGDEFAFRTDMNWRHSVHQIRKLGAGFADVEDEVSQLLHAERAMLS